jgi:hypothetical protein
MSVYRYGRGAHWIRVGHWILSKTPIDGKRVYYDPTPTRKQQEALLQTSWAPTDFELWGGHPNEVLTDYVGKPEPGGEGVQRNSRGYKLRSRSSLPPGAAKLAGLGTQADTQLSYWDPSLGKPNLGYSMATPTQPRDHYTFNDKELI